MDIDIDISPKVNIDNIFKLTHASIIEKNKLKKHLVGVYFQNIPKDPITNYAAIPYNQAEQLGYYKIDMLHVNLLEKFQNIFESKNEMKVLMNRTPNWKLLENKQIVEQLFHISNHFDVVYQIKPKSVLELADVLAIIRPGKKILIDKYIRNKKEIRKELYTKREKSDLRKSHAIPYALMIVIQLNLIELGLL